MGGSVFMYNQNLLWGGGGIQCQWQTFTGLWGTVVSYQM